MIADLSSWYAMLHGYDTPRSQRYSRAATDAAAAVCDHYTAVRHAVGSVSAGAGNQQA